MIGSILDSMTHEPAASHDVMNKFCCSVVRWKLSLFMCASVFRASGPGRLFAVLQQIVIMSVVVLLSGLMQALSCCVMYYVKLEC
jgi:hypothetical protein